MDRNRRVSLTVKAAAVISGARVFGSSLLPVSGSVGALALTAALLAVVSPPELAAQATGELPQELLERVMPGATEFGPKEGDPPVVRGYGIDEATGERRLVGYVFLTSDMPPEELGYSGPIEVLAGVDLEGSMTGALVVDYIESYRRTRGDFLRAPGFQEQFTGKFLSDPFRVGRDVDGISRATISSSAMTRGLRNAARRVATAYLRAASPTLSASFLGDIGADELAQASWPDLVAAGLVQKVVVLDEGVMRIDLSFAYLKDPEVASVLMGQGPFERALEQAGDSVQADHHVLIGIDGALSALFRPQALSFIQGSDTLRFGSADLVTLSAPRAGLVDGQFRDHGILFVDPAVDMTAPMTIHFDLRPGMGLNTTQYPGAGRVAAAASTPPPSGETPDQTPEGPEIAPGEPAGPGVGEPLAAAMDVPARAGDESGAEASTAGAEDRPVAPATEPPGESSAAASEEEPAGSTEAFETSAETRPVTTPTPPGPGPAQEPIFDFDNVEEETVLGRTLASTSWADVIWLVGLFSLVTAAFFSKQTSLRWVALTGTLLYLGIVDGGFLSVSHVTSAISVGPGVFLEDLPLLLMVTFTVVTTLLWGRVFCGFLCPFGVLQDILEKIVPRRFRRELPRPLHRRAMVVKYIVLAVVLLPVLAGTQISVFQYAEPFGTVFFLSPSILLWTIAIAVLAASAIVPRFYCRYACPLGAALALTSQVSPFRIKRVGQCTVCKVCEQACPTGAIEGPDIDFKECVRCNICEIKLIEKAGVCRHDTAHYEHRLVQLKVVGR